MFTATVLYDGSFEYGSAIMKVLSYLFQYSALEHINVLLSEYTTLNSLVTPFCDTILTLSCSDISNSLAN